MRTRGVCQNEMRQCGSGPFAWMDDDLLQREFLPRLADLQSVAAFTMTSHRHHRLACGSWAGANVWRWPEALVSLERKFPHTHSRVEHWGQYHRSVRHHEDGIQSHVDEYSESDDEGETNGRLHPFLR